MDNLKDIFHFFIDGNQRLSKRAAILLFALALLFLVDNHLNFSFNLKTEKKIEQLESINRVIAENKDSTIIADLKDVRRQIFERETFFEKLKKFGISAYRSASEFEFEKQERPVVRQDSKIMYTNFGQFLTVNWGLIIIFFTFCFFGFTTMKKDSVSIASLVIVLVTIFFMMLINANFVSKFQPWRDSALLAYFINVLIGAVPFFIIVGFTLYYRKKAREKYEN